MLRDTLCLILFMAQKSTYYLLLGIFFECMASKFCHRYFNKLFLSRRVFDEKGLPVELFANICCTQMFGFAEVFMVF